MYIIIKHKLLSRLKAFTKREIQNLRQYGRQGVLKCSKNTGLGYLREEMYFME